MPEQNNANGTEMGTEGGDNGTQEQTPPQTEVKDAAYWEAEAKKHAANADKWQALSRENEGKWKKATKGESTEPPNSSESTPDPLETYRTERVRDKARDKFETYAETLEADLNEVMKHVSIEAFIDDDSVKADEIKAYVERFAPPKKGGKFVQGVGVGPQGGGNAPTIDQRIAEAQKAGDTRGVIALKREKALSNSAK